MLNPADLLREPGRSFRAGFLAAGVLALVAGPATAQVSGYLNGAQLPYQVPPPPTSGPVIEMDQMMARALRAAPGSNEEAEAIADAQAYLPPDVMVRFGEAAHAQLNPRSRPILLSLLARALPESGRYLRRWKETYPRSRPYVGDASIRPCYERFLNGQESYPSGHAQNGMTVGLLIAEVIPARREALIARGIRYGQNRVACGVHYVSDVYQGQLVAADYVKLLLKSPAFQADLECARAEQRRAEQAEARKEPEALPARCTALRP